jgi:hypothetical protein
MEGIEVWSADRNGERFEDDVLAEAELDVKRSFDGRAGEPDLVNIE